MPHRTQFDLELDELKLNLIKMADTVIQSIHLSLQSFIDMNTDLATKIIQDDKVINQFEYDIEKLCMKIILREQPVAKDLRLITSVLKMITDLERIGDHAADISKLTVFMESNKQPFIIKQIQQMADESEKMIHMALKSFINQDHLIADEVIKNDDVVDAYFLDIKGIVVDAIRHQNIDADDAIYLMMATKYLERIADHAVNIAEWVKFSIFGEH